MTQQKTALCALKKDDTRLFTVIRYIETIYKCINSEFCNAAKLYSLGEKGDALK